VGAHQRRVRRRVRRVPRHARAALWFERNARKLGRAGLQQVTASMRAAGIRDALGNTRNRMRERFRRDNDE